MGIGRIVFNDPAIAANPGIMVEITGFGHAGDGQQQQVCFGLTHGIDCHGKLGTVKGVAG